MRARSNRLQVTVDHEMTVALEIMAGKTGLPLATQAMVVLRQGLARTIETDACQTRVKQDRAFRTRDQWLRDVSTETFVHNAMSVEAGDADDAPPA